jgi:hypothetical protein
MLALFFLQFFIFLVSCSIFLLLLQVSKSTYFYLLILITVYHVRIGFGYKGLNDRHDSFLDRYADICVDQSYP